MRRLREASLVLRTKLAETVKRGIQDVENITEARRRGRAANPRLHLQSFRRALTTRLRTGHIVCFADRYLCPFLALNSRSSTAVCKTEIGIFAPKALYW